LERCAAVLTAQLDLLERPQELYRQPPDEGRRLMNQAIFTELFLDESEDGLIEVVDQAYTTEVRELVNAEAAWRTAASSPPGEAKPENDIRPVRGTDGPDGGTLADLLRVSLSGVGVGPPW
jgi:hypothetical protein